VLAIFYGVSVDARSNFAYSTIATAPVTATAGTSLVVAAGHGTRFPAPPFNAVIWPASQNPLTTNAEIVRVTAVSTDTFTITRTTESSASRSVQVGDQIHAGVTSKWFNDIVEGPSSATANAIVRYDSTTGKLVKNTTCTINDDGDVLIKSVSDTSNFFRVVTSTDAPLFIVNANDYRVSFPGGYTDCWVDADSASIVQSRNSNTSISTADASLVAWVSGTAAGDPYTSYTIQGGTSWYTGVDNSDSDNFKVGTGSVIGTSTLLTLTSGGNLTLTGSLTAGSMSITGTASQPTVINESGVDSDFRVESDTNVNMLFVDASTNRVGIGTNLPSEVLHIVTSDYTTMRFDAAATEGFFYADGVFNFVVAGSRSATPFRIVYNAVQRMDFTSTENVLNDNSANIDTRIEGDTDANLFFLDASTDRIGIGTATPGSKLEVAGSIATAQSTKTANYTCTQSDSVILADATSGVFTVTLPTAIGCTGRQYTIKKIDSALTNLVTIATTSSQTIDGRTTYVLSQRDDAIVLVSDNANWRIVRQSSYDISAYRAKGSTLNRYFSSPSTGTALTTATNVVNTLYAMPLVIAKTMTIDQMAINITSAGAGSNVRCGIYADNGNMYPGALVVDAGANSTATPGVKTYTTNLPVILLPGLYWLACVCDGIAPISRGFAVASMIPILGSDSGLGTAHGFGWSVAFTYATLPATFTAAGTVRTSAPLPYIGVRTSI